MRERLSREFRDGNEDCGANQWVARACRVTSVAAAAFMRRVAERAKAEAARVRMYLRMPGAKPARTIANGGSPHASGNVTRQ
jgi:hypothetical protein